MTMLRRAIQRDFEGPWGPFMDGTIPPPWMDGVGAGMLPAGVAVSEFNALQLGDVWACSSLISDAISMLPMAAYRSVAIDTDNTVRLPLPAQPSLLTEPYPGMSATEWTGRVVLSMVLRGRGVAAITEYSGRDGSPTSAWPLHPDHYSLKRDKETFKLTCRLNDGQILQRNEFLYFPGLTLPGASEGVGVVDYHRRAIGLGIATEQFGANWFRDGAAPSSQLTSDQEIDDTDARIAQARWIASHAGRRRPAVLGKGLKWAPVTITPNESQFLETMKMNTERIARLFRVPLHLIQHLDKSTSWGAGLQEQGIAFVTFTLGIWIARLEAELSRVLPRPQYVKLNVSAFMRGNTKDRYLGYAIARQWGWMCVDDIRALEDLPPLPNGAGQMFLQPLNMVDAEEALKTLLKENQPPVATPPEGGLE